MHPVAQALLSGKTYELEVVALHEKLRVGGRDLGLKKDGVSLATIANEAKSFGKAMARDVASGEYKLSPALKDTVEVKGKIRDVYRLCLTDRLLNAAVANVIHNHYKDLYSANIHAYIKGKSYMDPVRSFATYVRSHFQSPGPKQEKGMWVLRRDIASYTDTIPVGEDSPLWPLLRKELGYPSAEEAHPKENIVWGYIVGVIRTEIIEHRRAIPHRKEKGIPTGSPISTMLFNFYMVELDRELDELAPGFYARYGDDLVVADLDYEKISTAAHIFSETLKRHWLTSREDKAESYYFTGCGRHPEKGAGKFLGSTRISFLGFEIKADGTVALIQKSRRNLLHEIRRRIRNSLRLMPQKTKGQDNARKEKIASPSEIRRACLTVAKALDPENRLCVAQARGLRFAVTNRKSLEDLDREISLLTSQTLTGKRGVRTLRDLSQKTLRSHGLPSLVEERNRIPG
jgi:retron-type reverse transcriptase